MTGRSARDDTLDAIPGIRLRKKVPLLPGLLGVRATEHRVRELLPKFYTGLIQRIHSVELARVDRRDLQQREQRAQVPRVDAIDVNRHVGSPATRERARRRTLFDRQQL